MVTYLVKGLKCVVLRFLYKKGMKKTAIYGSIGVNFGGNDWARLDLGFESELTIELAG